MIAPFPVRWPPEYRRLAESLGAENPLFRIGDVHPCEAAADPEALPDPTGEARLQPVPFVVRKHADRAVVLATSRCFFYCRFCFRRGTPPGPEREPSPGDWERIFQWLAAEPAVEEVILSGGDPLTLPDAQLRNIATKLASIPHLRRWRVHTRAPVVAPGRITPQLVRALGGPLPLRVVVHAVHPAELRPAFLGAIRRLQDAGIPLLDQTVLLRGVNDEPQALAQLFAGLAAEGISPYYLHHPDRAPGNAAFRLSIREGLGVYRELLECSPPVADGGHTPPYVLDLPNGAGKVAVEALAPVAEEVHGMERRARYRWAEPSAGGCEWWDVWEPVAGASLC
ncbi:MAG: radical SAM protein [Deltaproteobacteria bacterium]|nr:radical SAM protein [Deltaproteobacteria bacterium]